MKLSVIIPAYNEEGNINATIKEIIVIANTIPDINDFEIIVIDDHSSDDTFTVIQNMENPKVNCIRLSRRSGSYTALRAGFSEASGDMVLCISADGQDNPSSFKNMIYKLKHANIVWALRENRADEPFHVRIPANIFYLILNWLIRYKNNSIDLSRADFCLFDRRILDAVNICHEKHTSLFGLISWLGFKQDFIEYQRRDRFSGRSKWSLKSRMGFAKDWIVAFSGLPLRLISIIGSLVATFGFFYALIIILMAIFTKIPIRGWATTMVAILILGGAQMIMIGIIGEYLWRNLDETRMRPLYFIENSTRKNR